MAERHQPRGEVLYQCQALTDVWTGDAERSGGRLITTGLLGSIRWWFEVLVRGLGGRACDPSLHQCRDRSRCVVCELFGCTGWARKFRFEVLDAHRRPKQDQIRAGDIFHFSFVELRPIRDEEWALLDLTLRLIAGYGALGGRTVFKPSDEQGREKEQHHRDYGLIKIESPPFRKPSKDVLEAYLRKPDWKRISHRRFAWASLKNFWYTPGKYLARE
jgi:CRISPR-associated protein Cmr1